MSINVHSLENKLLQHCQIFCTAARIASLNF